MQSGSASSNAPAAVQPAPAQPAAPQQETPASPAQKVVSETAKPVSLRRKLVYAVNVLLLVALAGVAWWWFHRPAPAYRAQDPGIYPFQAWSADGKPQKWGFIDAEGNVLVQPEWDEVGSAMVLGQLDFCSEGLCGVRKDGKWGFINATGLPVIPTKFDAIGPFIEGRARAITGNRVGYIDKTGQYAVSPQFDNAGDFHDGLAAVHTDAGWGFINKLGAFIVTPHFQTASIDGFSDGLAGVCLAGKCGYIDRNGGVAINFIFDAVNTFSEGMASVQINGKWGFINTSGKFAVNLTPSYDRTTMFSGGLAGVVYKGQILEGPVNKQGHFPLQGVYERIPVGFDLQISEYKLWAAATSEGMGLLTRDGKWVVKPSRVLTGIGAIFGKVFQGQVSGQWVPISISGKVLAGPYKGAMLDSLAQDIDNESSALESMHVLTAAEGNYSRAYPARGFTSLDKLGPAAGTPDENHAGLIDAALATGSKDGYQFTVSLPDSTSNGRYLGCTIRARPLPGHAGREFIAVSYTDAVSTGIHYDVQGSPIDEFYPEANLDVTMQFILHKLNGIGTVSFIAYNNAGQRHLLKYEFRNISADQNQCQISYMQKFARDGSLLEDRDYHLPLHDVWDAMVKPYIQYETDNTSTDPPITAMLVRRLNGAPPQFFPFTDVAVADRVARALTHAAALCGGGT